MCNLLLRPGLPADLPAMYALDLLCFAEPFRFSLSAMRRFSSQPGAVVLLAEVEATLLGLVIVQLTRRNTSRTAYIVTLDVHPAYRRQGIARTLISQAEHHAAAACATHLSLHVSTENSAAIRFYERLGYTRTHLHSDFYAPGLNAWTYHKLLTS